MHKSLRRYDKFHILHHLITTKVKQSEYFDKYSEQAKEVITILLDKYVDYGLNALENLDTLRIPELENKYGTIMQIIMVIFSGIANFQEMLKVLKDNLSVEAT